MAKRERKATPNYVFSHWFQTIEGFNVTPSDFYTSVEQAVAERDLPNIKVTQVAYKEGGLFSSKRVYLRVQRKGKVFDVCGAPFGNGFFFSWWLGDRPPGLFKQIGMLLAYIPIIGAPFHGLVVDTYFKIDTMLMFQQAVSAAVHDVIDSMLTAQGVRAPLTADEKKPIMNL